MGIANKVFPYGIFVKLNDYPEVEGMIHISEVSSKWVKNIKDYAKEGETIVVKVLKVDAGKGHIDLSLKGVKANQKKMIVDQHKQDKKTRKLVELAAEKLKDPDNVDKIIEQLENGFDDATEALLQAKKDGIKVLKNTGIDDKWLKELGKIVEEYVTIPKVSIKASIDLKAEGQEGVETIKNAIKKAKEQCPEDIEAVFKYVGAPKYKVEITALDYKTLEKYLEVITKTLTKEMTSNNGTAEITRKK